ETQRERWVRAMLRTDLIACQLFSETEAGSDLAAGGAGPRGHRAPAARPAEAREKGEPTPPYWMRAPRVCAGAWGRGGRARPRPRSPHCAGPGPGTSACSWTTSPSTCC
ncbi:hypothetical protein, partial [Nocardia farcinica]|uniref:hypothetical protein n=1 Tax=Nocardia farcinica TaxID=37329 RepID=UPI002456A7D4